MITIWKYELSPDENYFELPSGYEILCVKVQRNKPHIWVKVNTENKTIPAIIFICGTGHIISEINLKYIDTFFIENFVFHAFEDLSYRNKLNN